MRQLQLLRSIVVSRLNPPYLIMAGGAVVAMGVVMAILLFATSNRGQTAFGIPLGADFAGFYVAAQILNDGQADQLYNRALHDELYHKLLPGEEAQAAIPYVHPPFVAGLLRPLAGLPYEIAFGIWLAMTAVLYLMAWVLLLKSIPWRDPSQNPLILLLACSFEPFLFECWLGGQLSVLAFCSFAVCFAALQREQPLYAGMALGLCIYKPTILILVLPLLVIGRRWRILLGMCITGAAFALLSVLLVGWNVSLGYVDVLLAFSRRTSGGELEIRVWKYVDLNNCLRLIFPHMKPVQQVLLVVIGMIPFAALSVAWWNYERLEAEVRRLLWATTVMWIPLLNLYFGIYDSILILQSLVITAALIVRRSPVENPLVQSGFAEFMLAIAIVPWFSQNLAATTAIPLYSLLMAVIGSYQLGWVYRSTPDLWPVFRRIS